MNGGEDYELLFTIGSEDFEKVEKHPGHPFHRNTSPNRKEGKFLVTKSGKQLCRLRAQGGSIF